MLQNNSEIVSQVWKESRTRLKGFINKRINNEFDAEDVLQNVFFKIYQNIDSVKDSDKLYPWIFQLTRNAIIDFYRERKKVDSFEEMPVEIAYQPSEKDLEEEVLNCLEPMVNVLPGKYREAVMLTDIKGLTQKELSEKLDISLSGAKSRVQRGRDKLKEALLNCCQVEFNRNGQIVEFKQNKKVCGKNKSNVMSCGCNH
jgi:RNA polymerase sigma-70 factor (ECF subfamily)